MRGNRVCAQSAPEVGVRRHPCLHTCPVRTVRERERAEWLLWPPWARVPPPPPSITPLEDACRFVSHSLVVPALQEEQGQ